MAIYRGAGGAGDATADASNAAAIANGFADDANASAGQAAISAADALAAQVAAELAQTNAETAETNAESAEAAAVIAKDAAEAVLLDAGFAVVASDLQGTDTIGTVADDIVNVNAVATNIASVVAVDANEANINIVAADGIDIGIVAGIAANVTTVAGISSDVSAVAGDATNIGIVAADIADVNTVAGIAANVTTVASISTNVVAVDANEANINAVSSNNSNITAVAGNATNINAVATNATNINAVNANATNINTVATNNANVSTVATNIANVNSVAGNETNINAVNANSTNINTVAGISSNVTTVATNNTNVTTVATNIASVNTVAGNTSNINQVASDTVAINSASANASTATTQAGIATTQATNAAASAAAASAVALGNEPVRHSIRPSLLLDFANTKTLDPRITFSRASTATYYDGKTTVKAEENLLLRSEEFDNAAWFKQSTTVTANATTAPDGNSTAEQIVENTNTAYHTVNTFTPPTLTSGQSYVLSVYAKNVDAQYLFLSAYLNSSGSANYASVSFDLSAGTVSATGQSGSGYAVTSSSITSVGSGWYRCAIVFTVGSSAAIALNYGLGASGTISSYGLQSYLGTSRSIYLWGAQLEQRSSVTAYTATTTAPITNYIPALQTAAAGVARFEHNPVTGESLGLEIEEQRTNLVLRSEEFATGWSASGSTISSNTIIAPNGSLVGDTLIPTASSGSVYQSVTIANATAHTWSVYAKAAGFNWLRFLAQDTVTVPCAWFDLATGAVGTVQAGVTATITSAGNGWYRCTVTKTSASTSAFMNFIPVNADGSDASTANGYSGIYIWGAQLEAGSFATSYIPTVASQVTRIFDYAIMTGTNFSSWYRADEGTLYGDALKIDGSSVETNKTVFSINDNGTSNAIRIGWNSSSAARFVVASAGAANVDLSYGGVPNGQRLIAAGYKLNDAAVSVNGGAVLTDTLTNPPLNPTQANIGVSVGFGTAWNGTIKKIAYYSKKLTNAELQGLTTV